jgi:hypothetical protein
LEIAFETFGLLSADGSGTFSMICKKVKDRDPNLMKVRIPVLLRREGSFAVHVAAGAPGRS